MNQHFITGFLFALFDEDLNSAENWYRNIRQE